MTCPHFQCRFLPLTNFLAAQFSRPKFASPGALLPGFHSVSRLIFWSFFSFQEQILAPVCCAFVPGNDSAAYNIMLDFPSASRVKSSARFWLCARHSFVRFSTQVL
jgi:hypothetical protein